MSNRIQYLTSLGTLQTKKGDWILNKRTRIPNGAGVLLGRRYTSVSYTHLRAHET